MLKLRRFLLAGICLWCSSSLFARFTYSAFYHPLRNAWIIHKNGVPVNPDRPKSLVYMTELFYVDESGAVNDTPLLEPIKMLENGDARYVVDRKLPGIFLRDRLEETSYVFTPSLIGIFKHGKDASKLSLIDPLRLEVIWEKSFDSFDFSRIEVGGEGGHIVLLQLPPWIEKDGITQILAPRARDNLVLQEFLDFVDFAKAHKRQDILSDCLKFVYKTLFPSEGWTDSQDLETEIEKIRSELGILVNENALAAAHRGQGKNNLEPISKMIVGSRETLCLLGSRDLLERKEALVRELRDLDQTLWRSYGLPQKRPGGF